MIHYAVDPGKTIGLAWYENPNLWDCVQVKDPYLAMKWLEDKLGPPYPKEYTATVEKYTGAGYSTAEGIYTTEMVGWFSYHLRYSHGLEVLNPISQRRLSGLSEATTLAKNMGIDGPHSWDALAHAIVASRMYP